MILSKLIVLLQVAIVLPGINIVAQTNTNKPGIPPTSGTIVNEKFVSAVLRENRIGLDPNRNIKVYLPPGYAGSGKSYPVVYYCHNAFWSAERLFESGRLVTLLERAFVNGIVKEFILVAADYSGPTTGCIFENSTTSGRWLDFTVNDLVPFIDKKFRTIDNRESRAVVGDFFGGRGALKLAMVHADIFSIVYALHPVATGTGDIPWTYINLDWKKILQAKSLSEISNGGERLFISFCQAYLPNANRPPFYCDFFMEMENGLPTYNVENSRKLKQGFLLDESLNEAYKNLSSMRGIAFDWGRFDETRAHVESNREFSRKLQDLGIEHEAEEYAGNPWNKNLIDNGRFYARVLPFLSSHLVFETGK